MQTRQVPSGVYTARVQLAGSADSRYRAGVDLRYEVAPPPGGERPLTVTPGQFDLRLAQGTQTTYRFKVERPTWTDALDPVSLLRADLGVVRNLRDLGNDEYEFTVDTANLPPGAPPNSGQSGYFANVLVRAGDFGGLAGVSINVFVDAPLSLGSPELGLLVKATTTAADLERSTTVSAIDGTAVRWNARSDQPWLKVLRGTGTTGVDALAYRIDPSVLALDGLDHEARLTIALDRPGTLPVEVPLVLRNVVPRFDMASPGVLTGSSAKVYLHGQVRRDSEVLLAGVLSVDGATVQSIGIEEDSRFLGSVPLLAVTLGGIAAGQPVTIRAASALRPASITLPSVAAVRVPVGYAALPFGAYRPASFASNGGALVFAGTDTVWRWPLAGSAWGALQRQDVAGVIDAAYAPDESVVYATVPNKVLALDPVTLVTRRQGSLRPTSDSAFDTAVAPLTSGFAFAADGRAFASVVPADPPQVSGHGVGWLAGCPGELVADLTRVPCFADPGAPWLHDISVSVYGAAIARSEDGSTVAMSYPAGPSGGLPWHHPAAPGPRHAARRPVDRGRRQRGQRDRSRRRRAGAVRHVHVRSEVAAARRLRRWRLRGPRRRQRGRRLRLPRGERTRRPAGPRCARAAVRHPRNRQLGALGWVDLPTRSVARRYWSRRKPANTRRRCASRLATRACS